MTVSNGAVDLIHDYRYLSHGRVVIIPNKNLIDLSNGKALDLSFDVYLPPRRPDPYITIHDLCLVLPLIRVGFRV